MAKLGFIFFMSELVVDTGLYFTILISLATADMVWYIFYYMNKDLSFLKKNAA